VSLVARIVLGGVFLLSGALKLRDRSWPTAARILGAPRRLVPLIAPTEIILGALLVTGVASPLPSLLAEVALVIFTIAILRVMRRPLSQRPVCACFGRWSARPVDSNSVVRNLILLALAVISNGS
jgi:uncharacterized membrane protein YphA (DoxX/SURF4 family)